MIMSLSRKERRREGQSSEFYQTMRKSAAVVGTTITACSVVAPLMTPVQAQAEESRVVRSNFAAPNTAAFITEIATYAQPVAQANDLYASVMIAQAILESGWGRSALSQSPNHNLFGIKGSYSGQTVYMDTSEYLNNQWVTMKEPFKKYPTYKESFEDNAATMRTVSLGNGSYYYAGAWKSNTTSYRDATQWLTGRYATAPNYASSLNAVIQQYNLTQYDTPASGNAGGGATVTASTNATSSVQTTATTTVSANGQSYTVVSGDSVWGIANQFGITMDQLCDWNNIRNNFVYPGQKLTVNGGSSQQTTSTQTVATTTTATATTTGSGSYTVASGESVWSVANKNGITMDQLRSWNNIKNDFIYPGQKLIVQNSGTTQATTTVSVSTSSSASTGNRDYTVVSGDSVWSISHKFGITMDQFRSWNNIKNDYVYPGQSVQVSGATASNQTTTQASNNGNYTVVSGDSVWGIADKFGISRDQFIQWNNIQNNFVYPGQSVRVK
jgi:flagellum-specific peptidoglycan hydrolase FlgJ/spore germination protein YaaH